MYKFLTSKGQLFALILALVVIAIFFGSVISGIGNAGYSTSDDLNAIMKANPDADFSFFMPGLMITVFMAVGAFIIAVFFGLLQVFSNPKGSLKAIIGFGVIAIMFFAIYTTADSDMTGAISATVQKFDISENISKMITGGLKTMSFLAMVAFFGAVILEIWNLFK